MMEKQFEIDWIAHDDYPESTCTCRCGRTFRSHAKAVARFGTIVTLTRKPCPSCGRSDNCSRISSDPETMEFGR